MKKTAMTIMVCIFLLGMVVSSQAALNAPIPVSPKVGYGETGIYFSSRTPTFSWSQISGATWYHIWVSKTSDPYTAVIDQWVKGNTTSWTPDQDRALDAGENYSWWVLAWNSTEESPWSNRADFQVGKRNFIMIPYLAFQPSQPASYNFEYRYEGYIRPLDSSSTYYYAPIILPNGSVIEKVYFYYVNNGSVSEASTSSLIKIDTNAAIRTNLITLTASKTTGRNMAYSGATLGIKIDTSAYYHIVWKLPSTKNLGRSVKLEYRCGDYK